MSSVAEYHFPRLQWRGGKRVLWNPILRKSLKNRPEERVRLRIIDYLLESGWSKNRISVEESIRVAHRENPLRTDIVCYNRAFEPVLLVECKAEYAAIDENAALQSARYNRSVQAPYLLLTNGRSDFWFSLESGEQPERLPEGPDIFETTSPPGDRPFTYWNERGFAGERAVPVLRDWIEAVLNDFWRSENTETAYLSFSNTPGDRELAHYFGITRSDPYRIAYGFLDTPPGESMLAAVANREGGTAGVVEIDLDRLAAGKAENTTLYIPDDRQHAFDAAEALNLQPGEPADPAIHRFLPGRIAELLETVL